MEDKTDRLLDEPTTLGEPYSRHLGGKLRELRFELDDDGDSHVTFTPYAA